MCLNVSVIHSFDPFRFGLSYNKINVILFKIKNNASLKIDP